MIGRFHERLFRDQMIQDLGEFWLYEPFQADLCGKGPDYFVHGFAFLPSAFNFSSLGCP